MSSIMARSDRVVVWLVALFIGAIVLAIPAGYVNVSYRYVAGSLESKAKVVASSINQTIISRNPEYWEYEKVRLEAYFSRLLSSGGDENGRILNLKNEIVVEKVNVLAFPVIKRSYDLTDAGAVVGRIEISQSLQPMMARAGLIALVTVPIGLGLFAVLWRIPIRRLRQAQNRITQSEERYRGIFEHVGDIIYTVEPDGTFSSISPSSERVLGWSPAEWIDRPFSRIIHPDDLSRIQEFFEKVPTGEPLPTFQVRVLMKSGAYLESEIAVNLVHRDDSVVMLGVLRDITERRRSEAALQKSRGLLQSVIEHVPARIFWKDRDSRYLGCNTQFAKDAGHDRPDELIGKTDFDMGWRDQAELYRADDKATMESGKPKLDYEEPQTTPDGKTIWLRTSKVPLRDESQQVIGILGLYQDITEQRRVADTLRENEARLDLALRSAGMGVWDLDLSTNKADFDDQVGHLLGFAPETFAGTEEEFYRAIHPDDREPIRASLTRSIEQGVPYEGDFRAVWPDGSVHDLTARAKVIYDDKGRPARVRGVIWDTFYLPLYVSMRHIGLRLVASLQRARGR